MVLNVTFFNNISVISWLAFLLVKETGVHKKKKKTTTKNHTDKPQVTDKL
jgi:hypothetical protein